MVLTADLFSGACVTGITSQTLTAAMPSPHPDNHSAQQQQQLTRERLRSCRWRVQRREAIMEAGPCTPPAVHPINTTKLNTAPSSCTQYAYSSVLSELTDSS